MWRASGGSNGSEGGGGRWWAVVGGGGFVCGVVTEKKVRWYVGGTDGDGGYVVGR